MKSVRAGLEQRYRDLAAAQVALQHRADEVALQSDAVREREREIGERARDLDVREIQLRHGEQQLAAGRERLESDHAEIEALREEVAASRVELEQREAAIARAAEEAGTREAERETAWRARMEELHRARLAAEASATGERWDPAPGAPADALGRQQRLSRDARRRGMGL